MKINEIIQEDTVAASIASVSFPLFGEPKMIRRAVDPKGYTTPKKKKTKIKPYTNKVKSIYPEK